MFKHYLKVSLRSLWQDKVYTLINIIGLTVALACCFLFIFWIRHELSFENGHPNADRIYMVHDVRIHPNRIEKLVNIQPPIAEELKATYPFVEEAAYVLWETLYYSTESGENLKMNKAWTTPEFFTLFPLECVAGELNLNGIQDDVGRSYISEETAIRFFGSAKGAVGKKLTYYTSTFEIDGVLRLPSNSHVRFDLINVGNNNALLEFSGGVHFVLAHKKYKLKETDIYLSEKAKAKLEKSLGNVKETRYSYQFQPLKDIHLYTDSVTERIKNDNIYYGDYKQVRLFAIVAILLLALAIINYVNTSTARSLGRSKEVGVRKVTGSDRKHLVFRFLMESFLVSLIAVILALDLAHLLHSSFITVMGNNFPFRLDGEVFLIAGLTCLITSILSGGYAAFYLSSFNIISALKGGTQTGSKDRFRKVLITLQFTLSIGILVCTAMIYRQLNYILTKDLGFSRECVYELNTNLWYQAEDFQQAIAQNPFVLDASMASYPPFNVEWGYSGVSWEGNTEAETDMLFAQLSCDYRFANTFGLQIVAGEFIQPGYTWWQWAESKSYSIVINETFARILNVDNPIGMTVTYFPLGKHYPCDGKIIGVVKDFMFKPMQEGMYPLIMNFNPEATTKMYIRIRPEQKAETLKFIEKEYERFRQLDEVGKVIPFIVTPLEDVYRQLYHEEVRLEQLLTLFSIISVFLSCMGIFSMLSFMLEKRTKEIAIRKMNGARVWDILALFFKEFSWLVGIASFISTPIALVLMLKWIEQYVYTPSFGWWIFLLTPLVMLLITLATIFVQVWQAALKNPIDSLRSE